MKKSLNKIDNNMKFYIANGIFFTIMTCLYKSFADKFIIRIGGTPLDISLYNSLPGLMGFFSIIPGLVIMSRSLNKKKTMSLFFLISRSIVLLYAFVPFAPAKYRALTFIILFALMNIPESLSVMALQSFSGDIFSKNDRPTAISNRNKYSTLFNVITSITLGVLFNQFGTTNSKSIMLYQIFFVFAFIVGLIEISTFMKLKEVTKVTIDKISWKDLSFQFSNCFKNKKFTLFLSCSLIFHFGWQMGWPLFSIYKINYLHANETWLTIINVSSSIVMFFSFNFWSKLIKKRGTSFVLVLATFGMALTPILHILSINLHILTSVMILTGFFTAGTITVILSGLLEVCPQQNRLFYIGIHATTLALTQTIAPLFGQVILSHSSIYMALIVCSFFRFAGSFAFLLRKLHNSH
ncbi:MAG: MFS transporter [Clostridiaceae bacterium]